MQDARTQADLDRILAGNPDAEVRLIGDGDFTVSAGEPLLVVESGQPRVVAWESSQPRVEAWGSSQPRVEAWESSQPRVVARESSQPRVVARESSQPRVEAWESSQPRVEAWESSQPRVVAAGHVQLSLSGHVQATATEHVSVHAEGDEPVVTGGRQHRFQRPSTAAEWCDYYGLPVVDGVVHLFKAVRDDYRSSHGLLYELGTMPEAPDWDGGEAECGGGLHFCPNVRMAQEFDADSTRFLICPVALVDIRAPKADDSYPHKVKARRICGPMIECDEDGEPLKS